MQVFRKWIELKHQTRDECCTEFLNIRFIVNKPFWARNLRKKFEFFEKYRKALEIELPQQI